MYISTRNNYGKVSASQAIKMGMVPPGGLFVPENIPSLSLQQLGTMVDWSYQDIAQTIISLYLDDFTKEEIQTAVDKAYHESRFSHPAIAPLHQLKEQLHILELWHGPTAAFKDMALQIMPHFLSMAIDKVGSKKEVAILVATSGDTGKAALEGFKDVPGIQIIVFYPQKGVSKIQELQMTTTNGNNTYVVAVEGNFDDCQNAVKAIFGDQGFRDMLDKKGYELSSANSINWGRLLPQIVYYFSSYLYLVKEKEISLGEPVNFVVPTGNFGNILAGWYASQMGLPVNKFICASNENKVLTEFLQTGVYNRNRRFKQTNSPSMDILISSNLERFLFELNGHDGDKIKEWMDDLNEKGQFTIDSMTKDTMEKVMVGGFADEEQTLTTIRQVFKETGYTLDTHTAVGVKVYEEYRQTTGDTTKTIVAATANPFKFNTSVLEAIAGPEAIKNKDEFTIVKELSQLTGLPLHPGLTGLNEKPVVHHRTCPKNHIPEQVTEILESKGRE